MSLVELPHVYQNREDVYDVLGMYFCRDCNGFYGVPHDFNHERHLLNDLPDCACRGHREREGLPRQGEYGWILKSSTVDAV